MVAGADRITDAVADEQRADRQAVPEALRERHEVGLDPELLVREERSGAPEPRLHLVDAEQRADLARDLRRGLNEPGVERNDAALAEDRLEQDRGELAAW